MTAALSGAAWCAVAVLLVFTLRRAVFLVAALLPARARREAAVPVVALLVPARNEEACVQAVLDAVARLDYPAERLTVVLVDDGSTDATGERFRRWAEGRPRALVLGLPTPVGKFPALNQAVALVPDVEVIAVCDADLRPHPGWLRELVAPFADGRVGSTSGLISPRNADNGPVARYAAVESWVHQLITSAAKDRLGLGPPTLGASAYRRAALQEVGLFLGAGPGGDARTSAALARAGWRGRFVRGAVVDNDVVERWPDYWHQHLRWARNAFSTARPRSSPPLRSNPVARVDELITAAGYGDRIALVVVAAFTAAGLLPPAPVAAYLAVVVVEVAVAVASAGRARRMPAFLLATVCFFAVDVAASFAATAHQLGHSPRRWRQPRRNLPESP